jgi:SWIM zinc finger
LQFLLGTGVLGVSGTAMKNLGSLSMPILDREQVLGLAPDPAAAKAGQGQAILANWQGLHRDDQAAWGECRGSGAQPYRCQVALNLGATHCSCPSRKLPCKHTLGLLLLLADGRVPAGPAGECPAWVSEWLTAVSAREAKRVAAAKASAEQAGNVPGPAQATKSADPQARQRRAANRDNKVDAGVAELRRWLADLARGGLAAAQGQPWQWWDQLARRMIDAQARGLANRVKRLAEIAAVSGHRSDWPDRMLDEIGAIYLLCEAWTRRDELPAATAAALRTRIGFTTSAAEVAQEGERITDTWAVLGQRYRDDGQIRSLHQWLYGERTGEVVSYLAFAPTGMSLEPGLPPGARSQATVALYPGALPRRALITERGDQGQPLGPVPGSATWDEALGGVAGLLAVDPWADIVPVAIRSVTVLPVGLWGSGAPHDEALVNPDQSPAAEATFASPWLLRDRTGSAVPIAASAQVRWRLLALSGGAPVDVAGEWDGFSFSPQAAAPAGRAGQLIA